MCRFAAYLGPPITVDRLVLAPAHSLVVQSYRPREMRSGVVNADGYGFGWYPDGAPPAVYTSVMPIWGDPNLPRVAGAIRSGCVLAAVRSATPGMTIEQSNVQPFAYGRRLFLHNGLVADFRRQVMRKLRDSLRDEYYQAIWGSTDSEHLWALILDSLHERADVLDGLRDAFARLAGWCAPAELRALLNVVIADGERLVATRHAIGDLAPSLYVLAGSPAWPGGVLVASERLDDDPAWREVDPGSALVVEAGAVRAIRL